MAYTKGMITRYAETIEDGERRGQFQAGVDSIQFNPCGRGEICAAGAFANALDRSPVADLADDFRARFLEFVVEGEL